MCNFECANKATRFAISRSAKCLRVFLFISFLTSGFHAHFNRSTHGFFFTKSIKMLKVTIPKKNLNCKPLGFARPKLNMKAYYFITYVFLLVMVLISVFPFYFPWFLMRNRIKRMIQVTIPNLRRPWPSDNNTSQCPGIFSDQSCAYVPSMTNPAFFYIYMLVGMISRAALVYEISLNFTKEKKKGDAHVCYFPPSNNPDTGYYNIICSQDKSLILYNRWIIPYRPNICLFLLLKNKF